MRLRPWLRWVIPAIGLLLFSGLSPFLVTCVAEERQALRGDIGDLSGAKSVEVRDAAGMAVLRGQFVIGSRRDDDNERIAALKATGTNGAAVETNPTAQGKNGTGGRKNGEGRRDGDKRDKGDERRNRKGEKAVARGKVEIETMTRFFGMGATRQKLELSVRGLTAGATYNLLIDGKPIASFAATQRGRADVVWEGPVSR
ncbi:MAG: hypothetical protein EHM89_12725 [Acidobacteria bacterium]|nr:MAG: hypothetical protein EHM89_12725 [Acidobacteriota bacterium]